ncbi:MAG: hypothetical protein HYW50_02215 [Candidatus Diapherotrites archaeon]|nr:hypothetical protein [Candidatus Diapherotrites archaeon]
MNLLHAIFAAFLVFMVGISGCLSAFGREPKPELCNQISNSLSKSNCFHRVAVRTGNSVYCSAISELSVMDLCFSDLAEGNTWASAGTSWD